MLRSSGFNATLDKMGSLVKRISKATEETVTKTQIKIKVLANGDAQYFLKSFQEKTNIPNIQSLFDDPVAWDKVGISLKDYDGTNFAITFADVEFDGTVTRIDVSRKNKDGIDKFTYILTVEKDEDSKIDSVLSNQYLRRLTRDINDKVIPEEFVVVMKQNESQSTTAAGTML